MINYILPSWYESSEMNMRFLKLYKRYPDYFYDNFNIVAVYDTPPYSIWNGGRIYNPSISYAKKEELIKLISFYNDECDIPIRYVFTNSCLEKKHYYDNFSNLLLKLGESYHNEIVIYDESLMLYIKENYPNYCFISSTTKCLKNLNILNKEINNLNYKLICLDYTLNKNIEFLKNIEKKNKIELLINEDCKFNCPCRDLHYKIISQSILDYSVENEMIFKKQCEKEKLNIFKYEDRNKMITYEDIVNIYEPMGFSFFKIEGRTMDPLSLITTYNRYMVKPEYRDYIMTESLRQEK